MTVSRPERPFLLHQLLARAAAADPSKEAVRCADRSLTYGELRAMAGGVARALGERGGVARGDRVGILLPKSLEMVAAVYGTLQAGAAYVPLDPKAPLRRVGMVAADCTVAAVVTTPDRAGNLLAAMGDHVPRLVLLVGSDADDVDLGCPTITFERATADGSSPDPTVPVIDDDLAYILYTSGSTGVPKGVMLTHRNALAFVEWSASRIGIGAEDRVSNHAPLHFDLSVFDLYLSALGGATLILVPDEGAYFATALADLIRDEGITVWYSVPSALMLLTRLGLPAGSFPSLRAVVFAGEVYPTRHLRELQRLVPDAELWNIYGPTETNVVTYYPVGELPDDDRTIPIGRACEGSDVFAWTEDGRVAGVGEEGELLARGQTVMKGYWGRPDRTAEVLVRDPRPGSLGDPVYRTGDLVRLRPDGNYDFLGRRDHQIKSRGYRIELGEVEAALNAHPSLVEAVAVAVPHEEWGTAIVAHVVPRHAEEPTASQIKKHLVSRIPRYMIPARIEFREALPRNPNGKIDRPRIQSEAEATPL